MWSPEWHFEEAVVKATRIEHNVLKIVCELENSDKHEVGELQDHPEVSLTCTRINYFGGGKGDHVELIAPKTNSRCLIMHRKDDMTNGYFLGTLDDKNKVQELGDRVVSAPNDAGFHLSYGEGQTEINFSKGSIDFKISDNTHLNASKEGFTFTVDGAKTIVNSQGIVSLKETDARDKTIEKFAGYIDKDYKLSAKGNIFLNSDDAGVYSKSKAMGLEISNTLKVEAQEYNTKVLKGFTLESGYFKAKILSSHVFGLTSDAWLVEVLEGDITHRTALGDINLENYNVLGDIILKVATPIIGFPRSKIDLAISDMDLHALAVFKADVNLDGLTGTVEISSGPPIGPSLSSIAVDSLSISMEAAKLSKIDMDAVSISISAVEVTTIDMDVTSIVLEAPVEIEIKTLLGTASEPAVLGQKLGTLLTQLITALNTHTHPTAVGPSAPSIDFIAASSALLAMISPAPVGFMSLGVKVN